MYGYEGIHEDRPRNNGTPTVPTAKMKAAISRDFLALRTRQYQIYNPFTRSRSCVGGGRYPAAIRSRATSFLRTCSTRWRSRSCGYYPARTAGNAGVHEQLSSAPN